MPAEVFGPDYPYLPRASILSFEEIVAIARAFVDLGVRKLRLTGGEPLLRRDLTALITELSAIDGVEDLALTTNGLLLPRFASELASAGLKRLTVSLDAMDESINASMNGGGASVADVLKGIDAAEAAGFDQLKINAVIQRGINDNQIEALIEHFAPRGHIVRFIEFMDVGNSNGWDWSQVLPAADIVESLRKRWSLNALSPAHEGEVARRWMIDGVGEIGFITSVSNAFCGDCNRARISARGELFTCLFANEGTDLRPLVRSGASHEALCRFLGNLWRAREDRYSELRGKSAIDPGDKVEMSHIGG